MMFHCLACWKRRFVPKSLYASWPKCCGVLMDVEGKRKLRYGLGDIFGG